MTAHEKGILRYKWNYKISIYHPENIDALSYLKELENIPAPDIFNVRDLKKTKDEIITIEELLKAYKIMTDWLGKDNILIPIENIHILSPDEFRKKLPYTDVDRFNGFAIYNHCYVMRGVETFLHDLSHEMAHLLSFCYHVARLSLKEEGKLHIRTTMLQSGVNKHNLNQSTFNGLNEALTEKVANILIREVLRVGNVPSRFINKTNTSQFYFGQVYVLDYLVRKISNTANVSVVQKKIIMAYTTGNLHHLDLLLSSKSIRRIIKSMGTGVEDAETTARAIGNQELIDKIRNTESWS